jgi:autotransporter adhesin
VGHYAGRAITTPYQNSAFGFKALCAHTTGCRQIAIGACALYSSTTGNSSIAIGHNANTYNATNSIAIGRGAIASQNRGVAIGLNATVGGENSVAIGASSRSDNANSVAIGYRARAEGCCSIAIGYNIKTLYDNQISIGSNFANYCCAGTITMGNTSNNTYNCIYVDWTYCSDRNEKTNIQALPYNFGLPFIKKLRPVKFNWDIREKYVEKCGFEFGQKDGTLAQEKENYGLIAQELEQVLQELNLRFDGLTKNDKRYHLASTNLLAPLVKSIQQLSVKLEAIKERLTTLENN